MQKTAIIIGAGPAGLTAAYELLNKTDIKPIIIEKCNDFGGISKTIVYKGNRLDIGGHRFFSKSQLINEWWLNIMPISTRPEDYDNRTKSQESHNIPGNNISDDPINAFIRRKRISRIYYAGKFYDYPIKLNYLLIRNLGIKKIFKIIFSYLLIIFYSKKEIKTLEDFFISRFGKELYLTFFKEYTEKVWGIPCSDIPASWGSQRIKKLSVTKTLIHAIRPLFNKVGIVSKTKMETSLIEEFIYPKQGPGQLWTKVADLIREKGGIIILESDVINIQILEDKFSGITILNNHTKKQIKIDADYLFSSIPVKELINSMGNYVPEHIKNISNGLEYRDFITIGILLNKLLIKNKTTYYTLNDLIPDNWIYIQDGSVKLGRLQIFNNWSPYLVTDENKVWLGLEYFCNEDDELWRKEDEAMISFAIDELSSLNIISRNDVLDATIVKVNKAYPSYAGTYNNFKEIQEFLNKMSNVYPIGRNGMHKYNNQDHSMMTAIASVNTLISGVNNKESIWEINTEEEYNEA